MKIAYLGFIYESYSRENFWLLSYLKDPSHDYGNSDFSFAYEQWLNGEPKYKKLLVDNKNKYKFFDAITFNEDYPEILKEFENEFKKGNHNISANGGYTKAHLGLARNKLLPRTTWLVHFSDNAEDIVQEGFKYGEDDYSDLALTTHKKE